jgi:hypothetical protein
MVNHPNRSVNKRICLYRDDPAFNAEISASEGFPWHCDIWEKTGEWPLFATAWGKTRTEAMSKANSIVQQCSRELWTEVGA